MVRERELASEPVWPSGKGVGLVSRTSDVRFLFGSPFSSKVVVCGHCLGTLSLTINETLKWLSSLPGLNAKIVILVSGDTERCSAVHTASITFRHRKDVVNRCLEFVCLY